MTQAAVVLIPPARPAGRGGTGRSAGAGATAANLRAAAAAGFADVIGVLTDERAAAGMPEGVTLLLDEADVPDEASSLRAALDYCARAGHDVAVVALQGAALLDSAGWAALAAAGGPPVRVGVGARGPVGAVRLDASVWALLPLEGRADVLWRARPELAAELALDRAR